MADLDIDDVRKMLSRSRPHVETARGVSTGSTLLNLALTDTIDAGYLAGNYTFLVGDSATGKTWVAFAAFAEACRNPAFADYSLVFYDVENGAQFDVAHYFGQDTADRVEVVTPDGLEAFYDDLDARLAAGPVLAFLDSMDALKSAKAEKAKRKQVAARKQGKEESGSYGTDKARENSSRLRLVVDALKRHGSIFVCISQTRDNIGFGAKYNPKTRSGGKALTFYAHAEVWTSVRESVRRKVKGKDRDVGNVVTAAVKKNRQTGQTSKVELILLHGHGIDDVGSCVRYLVEEGHWPESKGTVTADEFDFSGPAEKLVRQIEDDGAEPALRAIVASVWREIRDKSIPVRKARYT